MRSILLILISVIFISQASGQTKRRAKAFRWTEWSDSAAFFIGPIPLVQGYGLDSDSLTHIYGYLFYNIKSDYYRINSVADYYYWFVRKYDFLFKKDISAYELFYHAGDDWNMTKFIKENYTGRRLPIKVNFYDPFKNPRKSRARSKRGLASGNSGSEYDKNVSDKKKWSKKQNN